MRAVVEPMSWDEIVRIEPRIGEIIADSSSVRNAKWSTDFIRIKPRLSKFVGWNAEDPRLCGEDAFQLAIDKLAEALDL